MAIDGENKKKLSRWLRPLMFPFEETEPRAAVVAVKHVAVSGKLADVRAIKISEPRDEARFASIMVDIEQAALDDVEGTGGVQRYVVQALDEAKHAISRLTLRYQATRSEDEMEAGFESEPASAQGVTAQLMRHNEARERIDKAGWGNIINTQRLQIESLTEQNGIMMQKHLDMLALMEELQQAKHEREIDMLKAVNAAEIKQGIGRTFTALLPAIAKKLTGEDIGGIVDPDTMSMRQLLQTLKEDQLEAIQGILSPEQTLALLSMLKSEAVKPNN
jgi:hypothetical protein